MGWEGAGECIFNGKERRRRRRRRRRETALSLVVTHLCLLPVEGVWREGGREGRVAWCCSSASSSLTAGADLHMRECAERRLAPADWRERGKKGRAAAAATTGAAATAVQQTSLSSAGGAAATAALPAPTASLFLLGQWS